MNGLSAQFIREIVLLLFVATQSGRRHLGWVLIHGRMHGHLGLLIKVVERHLGRDIRRVRTEKTDG